MAYTRQASIFANLVPLLGPIEPTSENAALAFSGTTLSTAQNNCSSWMPGAAVRGDQEVFVTQGTASASSNQSRIFMCLQRPGSPTAFSQGCTGYALAWDGVGGGMKIQRADGAGFNVIATGTAYTATPGDVLTLLRRGGVLYGLVNGVVFVRVSDGTYDSGLYGVRIGSLAWTLSDFGGGKVNPDPFAPVTQLLDWTNRADETPLSNGGTWTTPAWTGQAGATLNLASNTIRTAAQFGSYRQTAAWIRDQITFDQEAYFTIAAWNTGALFGQAGVLLRLTEPGTSRCRYMYGAMEWDGSGIITLLGGSGGQVAGQGINSYFTSSNITLTPTASDVFCVRTRGVEMEFLYRRSTSPEWERLWRDVLVMAPVNGFDPGRGGQGRYGQFYGIGVYCSSPVAATDIQLTNFGGGSLGSQTVNPETQTTWDNLLDDASLDQVYADMNPVAAYHEARRKR